jgi:N-acyl-D-aspartate/D-glutamate deacylase
VDETSMKLDLVITGGTIVDGRGGKPFAGDVTIAGGRIQSVGSSERPEGVPVLDARGLVVAPGFIDIHSHSDYTLYVDPRGISSITQGVTLEVVGNCGHGCAPFTPSEGARGNIYGYQPGDGIPWRGVGEYLDALEARHPAVNVATLVPNGCLRLAVCQALDRPSSPGELERMKDLLRQGLEEGAFGFSTGLEYASERACSEEEIIELCRLTARSGGLYATHTRNRQREAKETIAEAIRTCAASDGRLQISHISSVARLEDSGRWAVEQALEQVDQARSHGLDVAFDMHTRSFGMTNLSAILAPWVVEGDRAQVAARLGNPGLRRRMKTHPSIVTALARNDWSRLVVTHCRARTEANGKTIADLAKDRDPFDIIYDLLLDEIDQLHSVLVLAFVYRAEDTHLAFEHPACLIGSDATALAPDRPLCSCLLHGAFTWAAWFYRHFVRDTQRLSMPEAVRRLTSLPARRMGLNDRGVLSPGAWADIAVFNPDTYAERGTIDQPDVTASGMVHVLVNGRLALHNGQPTGQHNGQILRRT